MAIELYTKLIKRESSGNNKNFNSTIYLNRALCYQKKNKIFEALEDVNKSIELNDSYWKAYYRRATIYIELKTPNKAKQDLNKVIQLDPSKKNK